MTPTFSGGVVYEFFEGPNRYGLVHHDFKERKVEVEGEGQQNQRAPLDDFRNLKRQLKECEGDIEAVMAMEPKDAILGSRPWPPAQSNNWRADTVLPVSPVDWDDVVLQFEDRQWVDVQREMEKEQKGGVVAPSSSSGSSISATRSSFWQGLLPIRSAAKQVPEEGHVKGAGPNNTETKPDAADG
jgi:hypothetical protein